MKKRLTAIGLSAVLSLALVGCDDPDDGVEGDLNGDNLITDTTLTPTTMLPPTTPAG
jgi:hypothetical protein